MEAQIYLLILVVTVFMAGAGVAAYLLIERLRETNQTLADVDKTLKVISAQISTEVQTELGAINRNTKWTAGP